MGSKDNQEDVSIPKTIFIILKVTIIIGCMFMGCLAHMSKTGRINSVVKLFVFYVLVMALLCYYEFVNNQIQILFINLVLAGIGQIQSLNILVNKARKY